LLGTLPPDFCRVNLDKLFLDCGDIVFHRRPLSSCIFSVSGVPSAHGIKKMRR
jgi:hypothetical protein